MTRRTHGADGADGVEVANDVDDDDVDFAERMTHLVDAKNLSTRRICRREDEE